MTQTSEKVSVEVREGVIHRSPDTVGGTAVFKGTRVPIKNLLDYLEGGHNLDEFLADFPNVSREQAVRVIELAKMALMV